MHVQDGLGERLEMGTPLEFDILEGSADSGSTIDIEDLDFWAGPDDNENPNNNPGDGPSTKLPGGDKDGCRCTSSASGRPGHLPGDTLTLAAINTLGWRRRRRRNA